MTGRRWLLIASVIAVLEATALGVGWSRESRSPELVRVALERSGQFGPLECNARRVLLDRSARTGLSRPQSDAVVSLLKESGCDVAALPDNAWANYDSNELRKLLNGCPGDVVAVSVSVASRTPWDNRVVLRWSTGCVGELHEMRVAWYGYAWKRDEARDRHQTFVTFFQSAAYGSQQSNPRLDAPHSGVTALAQGRKRRATGRARQAQR